MKYIHPMVVSLSLLVSCAGLCPGAEEGGPPRRAKERRREVRKPAVTEVVPPDEQGNPLRLRRQLLPRARWVNVVDRARWELARLHLTAEEYEEAIEVLRETTEKSPNEQARSAAYSGIGRILIAMIAEQEGADKDAVRDRAREAFAQVTGYAARLGYRAMAYEFTSNGDGAGAIEELRKIADLAPPEQKVAIAEEMMRIGSTHLDEDGRKEMLAQIPQFVDEKIAEEVAAARREEQKKKRAEALERKKKAGEKGGRDLQATAKALWQAVRQLEQEGERELVRRVKERMKQLMDKGRKDRPEKPRKRRADQAEDF